MGQLNFSMPSIWEYLPIYKQLLGDKRDYIKDNINFDSVFGVFAGADKIAGGRFLCYQPELYPSQQDMIDTVKFYNDNNVSVRYTFSNLVATEKHLDDPMVNFALDIAHNEMNGIIVGNPVIENYIRTTFPKYKIISSITNWNTTKDYARSELDRGVDMLVLNSALIRDYDFIKTLDLSRVEIMINDGCVRKCANRFEHYSMESHMNLNYDAATMYNDTDVFSQYHEWAQAFCTSRPIPDVNSLPPVILPNEVPYDYVIPDEELEMFVDMDPEIVWELLPEEFDTLVDLGVVNFKIAGRELQVPPMVYLFLLKTDEQNSEMFDIHKLAIEKYNLRT